MIIELLLDVLYGIFSLLTLPINLPTVGADFENYLNTIFDYLEVGANYLWNFVDIKFLLILLGVVISVDVGVRLYHFVMWILRKIPMLNIS